MFSKRLALALMAAFACNNDKTSDKAQTSATPPATSIATPTPPPTASAEPVKKVELEIASIGDEMKFDKDALTVPAKAEVHLTLTNKGKLEAMTHNWILVRDTVDIPKFAADALAAGIGTGYVPKSDDVIAFTPLVSPGKTGDVTFIAPKYAGKYPYVCTFPGHYLTMKGVLTVTP